VHCSGADQLKRPSSAESRAGPGGIEPPNGGIKIRLVIQRFQGTFEKNAKNAPSIFNSLVVASK
jgi:hypothetical protein